MTNKRRNKGRVNGAPPLGSQRAAKRTAPLAASRRRVTRRPRVANAGPGVLLQHSEQLGLVLTSATQDAFSVVKYEINPGIAATFPWGAAVANKYETYSVEEIRFEYVARCAATQRGIIMMACDYDALDPPPQDEQSLMSYVGATQDAVWCDQSLRLDRKAAHGGMSRKYTRDVFKSGDKKTYDVGSIFIATASTDAAVIVGSVFIHYKIRLFTPQTNPVIPVPPVLEIELAEDQALTADGQWHPIDLSKAVLNGLGATRHPIDAYRWLLPPGVYSIAANIINDVTNAGAQYANRAFTLALATGPEAGPFSVIKDMSRRVKNNSTPNENATETHNFDTIIELLSSQYISLDYWATTFVSALLAANALQGLSIKRLS